MSLCKSGRGFRVLGSIHYFLTCYSSNNDAAYSVGLVNK